MMALKVGQIIHEALGMGTGVKSRRRLAVSGTLVEIAAPVPMWPHLISAGPVRAVLYGHIFDLHVNISMTFFTFCMIRTV